MHFVISVFIVVCIIALAVLFAEVFPRWVKIIMALLGSALGGYAAAILIRYIAKHTKWYAVPKLLDTFYITAPCALILTIIVVLIISKKSKKA
ncbi:MAG: hypothetical protein ACSW8B_03715 [bacterium]